MLMPTLHRTPIHTFGISKGVRVASSYQKRRGQGLLLVWTPSRCKVPLPHPGRVCQSRFMARQRFTRPQPVPLRSLCQICRGSAEKTTRRYRGVGSQPCHRLGSGAKLNTSSLTSGICPPRTATNATGSSTATTDTNAPGHDWAF